MDKSKVDRLRLYEHGIINVIHVTYPTIIELLSAKIKLRLHFLLDILND